MNLVKSQSISNVSLSGRKSIKKVLPTIILADNG